MFATRVSVTTVEHPGYPSFVEMRETIPEFDEFVRKNPMPWITRFNLNDGFTADGDYDPKLDVVTDYFGVETFDEQTHNHETRVGGILRKIFDCKSITVFSINSDRMHVTDSSGFFNLSSKMMFLNGEMDGISSEYDSRENMTRLSRHSNGELQEEHDFLDNGFEEIRYFVQGKMVRSSRYTNGVCFEEHCLFGDGFEEEFGADLFKVYDDNEFIQEESKGWMSRLKATIFEVLGAIQG